MQGAAAATERPKKEVAEAQKHTMEFGMTQVIEGSRQGDVAVRVVKASLTCKSKRRTSKNACCSSQSSKGCRQEEIPTRLHERMSAIMGISPENNEDLQLLK